jgi:hypothetical protein
MTDQDKTVADVLSQFVEPGASRHEAELGTAVSDHISNHRPATRRAPDPETVTALRSLAADPTRALGEIEAPAATEVTCSPLWVGVDFNVLLTDVGEPEVWTILGKLKDLFGGTS